MHADSVCESVTEGTDMADKQPDAVDWKQFTVHHIEQVQVTGLTASEVAELVRERGIPDRATLTTGIVYDADGPEVFLEWHVSVAEANATR